MNRDMYSSRTTNRQLSNQQSGYQPIATTTSTLYRFEDIEAVIQLAHRVSLPFFNTTLHQYKDQYWLSVHYPPQRIRWTRHMVESLVLEYGEKGDTSVECLLEYGNEILSENAIATIREYFSHLY